jgi:hypothetical protein
MVLETEKEGIVPSSGEDANFAKVNVWLEAIATRVKEPLKVGKSLIPTILRNHIDECWTLG